jgi:hypothetical protein
VNLDSKGLDQNNEQFLFDIFLYITINLLTYSIKFSSYVGISHTNTLERTRICEVILLEGEKNSIDHLPVRVKFLYFDRNEIRELQMADKLWPDQIRKGPFD